MFRNLRTLVRSTKKAARVVTGILGLSLGFDAVTDSARDDAADLRAIDNPSLTSSTEGQSGVGTAAKALAAGILLLISTISVDSSKSTEGRSGPAPASQVDRVGTSSRLPVDWRLPFAEESSVERAISIKDGFRDSKEGVERLISFVCQNLRIRNSALKFVDVEFDGTRLYIRINGSLDDDGGDALDDIKDAIKTLLELKKEEANRRIASSVELRGAVAEVVMREADGTAEELRRELEDFRKWKMRSGDL